MTEFRVRIDDDTHKAMSESAAANGRSTNSEYVEAIKYYLNRRNDNDERLGRIELMMMAVLKKLGITRYDRE